MERDSRSFLLDGDPGRADPILAHAAEVGIHAGALPAASIALAERDDWDEAEALARRAQTIIQDGRLEDYISVILVSAVTARVAIRRGDLRRAKEHLARAGRLRPLLTTAELRLLPLLATHLSFREIGERLFVSPNTVKTQAMSIYRKFGAASRSEAIQRAQQLDFRP